MLLQDSGVDLLSALPIFAGASASSLAAILFLSTRRTVRPGEPILSANERVDCATLIVSGEAEQTGDGDGVEPLRYGPGTLLEEMAMFVETVSERTVVARSLTQIVEISPPALTDVLRSDPDLTRLLTGRIAERLRRLTGRLHQLDDTLARLEPAGGTAKETVSAAADRTPPEPAHDPTDGPSRAPRQQPALSGTNQPAPASPRHGPAGAPGSNGASPSPGSSTT